MEASSQFPVDLCVWTDFGLVFAGSQYSLGLEILPTAWLSMLAVVVGRWAWLHNAAERLQLYVPFREAQMGTQTYRKALLTSFTDPKNGSFFKACEIQPSMSMRLVALVVSMSHVQLSQAVQTLIVPSLGHFVSMHGTMPDERRASFSGQG